MALTDRRFLSMILPLAFVPVAAGAASYEYDAAGRLARADFGSAIVEYSYDTNGNLLERVITAREAGVLAFADASVSVDEGVGVIEVGVSRSGGASGAVTVDFEFLDGSAVEGADYNGVAGSLSWPDGDATPRSIAVTILEDQEPEADETFAVTLLDPSGNAAIGAVQTTTITIRGIEGLIFGSSFEG